MWFYLRHCVMQCGSSAPDRGSMFSRRGRLTGRIKRFEILLLFAHLLLGLSLLLALSRYILLIFDYSRICSKVACSSPLWDYGYSGTRRNPVFQNTFCKISRYKMIYRANNAEVLHRRSNWDEGTIWSFERWPGVSLSSTSRGSPKLDESRAQIGHPIWPPLN